MPPKRDAKAELTRLMQDEIPTPDVDERFQFKPQVGPKGTYRVRIWRGIKCVVIISEQADNSGQSVTNAAEVLAKYVAETYGLATTAFTWIEHYNHGEDPNWGGDMDHVHFEYNHTTKNYCNPRWQRISQEMLLKRAVQFKVDPEAEYNVI